ncbi:hypothetical protein HMPREF0971_01569 [Segatella oris F0302]|uniref:Uncharacterized protein n=1 Tax=Segatella oris F0302 TaxID=649760 RepID=D1QRG3_9BACT|nr:hypothetical protein HMPREF0971_01569 [Segatella oris F0302]
METKDALTSVMNIYNCSSMLCKFKMEVILTQNKRRFLTGCNTLTIR